MLLKRTNIERKLELQQRKIATENSILEQVEIILNKDLSANKRIDNTLTTNSEANSNAFNLDLLDTQNIYHIDAIQAICIDYRLRFLDSKYFKSTIPEEAIKKIKDIEGLHRIHLQGFKIVAPSKLFKLDKTDDPLLFAPIGNDYYYLIHKWGNDLHPLRKWLMLPFRNFETLAFTTLIISFLATFLVPNGIFSVETSASEFWMIFFFMFKSIAAVVIFYGFSLGKNFNTAIWNCRYNKA